VIAGLMSVTAAPAAAQESPAAALDPVRAADLRFMQIAIEEARRGDFPFGAVIVRDGAELARGRNLGRANDDPTAHGEMVAIRRCLSDHGSPALRGSTIYTSGEPCAMCMGAILWCGFGRLVFAASVAQLATKIDQIMLSSAEIAARTRFVPISITGGVLAAEAMSLFR
jgi:tRNA(Arg) A34 adenosine deaminase TadA